MHAENRRCATRFKVSEQSVGRLRIVQDVEIERLASDEIRVVGPSAIPRGEHLRLDIADDGGASPRSVRVRAVGRRALIRGGRLLHRAWLHVVGEGDERGDLERVPLRHAREKPLMGALLREVPIRLLDLSLSGCLCESPAILGVGTVGVLEVTLDGRPYSDAVRICRSVRRAGRLWSCGTGSQFLTLAPPSPESLRGLIAMLESRRATGAGHESGALDTFEHLG